MTYDSFINPLDTHLPTFSFIILWPLQRLTTQDEENVDVCPGLIQETSGFFSIILLWSSGHYSRSHKREETQERELLCPEPKKKGKETPDALLVTKINTSRGPTFLLMKKSGSCGQWKDLIGPLGHKMAKSIKFSLTVRQASLAVTKLLFLYDRVP